MPAPVGNRFWEARSSHGRHKIFETPEILRAACLEYFEWVEANPLSAAELVKYQGVATVSYLPRMRAMTIAGLCLFLGITQETWSQYRQNKDFTEVVGQAEQIIREQKFTGAAADLLNPNIIARDLGLRDGMEHTGKDGEAIKTELSVDRNLARRIAFMLSEAAENTEA